MDNKEESELLVYKKLYLGTYVLIEVIAGYFAWQKQGTFSSIADCLNVLWDLIVYSVIGTILYVAIYLFIGWLEPKAEKVPLWVYLIPVPVIVFAMAVINVYL